MRYTVSISTPTYEHKNNILNFIIRRVAARLRRRPWNRMHHTLVEKEKTLQRDLYNGRSFQRGIPCRTIIIPFKFLQKVIFVLLYHFVLGRLNK